MKTHTEIVAAFPVPAAPVIGGVEGEEDRLLAYAAAAFSMHGSEDCKFRFPRLFVSQEDCRFDMIACVHQASGDYSGFEDPTFGEKGGQYFENNAGWTASGVLDNSAYAAATASVFPPSDVPGSHRTAHAQIFESTAFPMLTRYVW